MERYAPIHPERPLRRAALAVVVSLGVHAALLALLAAVAIAYVAAQKKREAESPKQVALAPLDAARWEENRSVAGEYVPSAAFDDARAAEARPEKARFLSDRDRRAERETVAAPAPGMIGRPSGADPRSPERAEGAASPPGAERPAGVGETAASDGEGASPRSGPDLQARPLANRPLAMNFDVGGEGGVPEVDGVAVGNLTVLNAEAWRYATFFDRVGDTLYGVWRIEFIPRPPPLSVQGRPRGGVARVALSVTLDASGRAIAVGVRKSSGLPDVDALLAELVRESAPFANVPPGLLDASGRYSDTWILALVWGRRGLGP